MRLLRRSFIASCSMVVLATCGGSGDSGMPPTVTLGISAQSIAASQDATLTWSSTNANGCQATGAWSGPQSASGSLVVSQATPGTYTYTLSCSAPGSTDTATQSVTLTVTPAVMAIIGTLSNGVVGLGFNRILQVTRGVPPFTWTVTSGALPHNLSLSNSTTDSVLISGIPDTAVQGQAFTIEVSDSANNSASQSYAVSILLQPDSLLLSAPVLAFGGQVVGSQGVALTETLTNNASSPIAINGMAIGTGPTSNAGEFTPTSTTCGSSLAAGANCAVIVTFTPGQTGPRAGVLTLTDDTPGSPQSVGLNGAGLSTQPNATLSADSLPLGTQLLGTTGPPVLLTLTNYGAAALTVTGITTTSQFAESDNCIGSLAPLGTCTIGVTFTPSAAGAATGTLSITDNAAGSPQQVALSATGSTSTPTLTGSCLALCVGGGPDPGQCPAGTPANHAVTLQCPAGQAGSSIRVDGSRPCFTGGSIRAAQGYCGTH